MARLPSLAPSPPPAFRRRWRIAERLANGLLVREPAARAGFYFCVNLLQLMQSVYIDLNLEEEHDHPDNRGWMNLFKHWSWATMLRATYAICCSTFGARFQTFCARRLDLEPGRPPVSLKLATIEVGHS